jgi:NADH:ubiquinone reductase (non-electrogenic)
VLLLTCRTDAERIRRRILNLFEAASIPGVPEEERKKLLSFVVVGGGPTGVEFAAELNGATRTLIHPLSRAPSLLSFRSRVVEIRDLARRLGLSG